MQEVSEKSSFMAETCPSSDSGGELELANYWLEQSIQNEIIRGTRLREQKLKAQLKERPFDAAATNAKPPKPAKSVKSACCNNRKPSPQSRDHNGFENIRKRARSNSPRHPNARTSSPMSQRTARSTNSRARPVCSMRISELAVPTKRQCIDTWRKKADVLPGFMVDRLKEQVMDQKPIVQVSDAVNCFKYDKKSSAKRTPRKINKEAMVNRALEENQIMSSVFGHRIAQKLNKPSNITLNSQLQKLSSVVTEEICCVMKDRQRLRTDDKTYERMVKETSEKVTIWIADILEETSEKLLEEDLRVKRMNDRTPANDGELITLIGTMVQQDSELEEQEGPVLDILEDLVDNIVDLLEAPSPSVTKETYDIPQIKSSDVDLVQSQKDEANNVGNVSPDYLSVSSEEDEYDYGEIPTDAIDKTTGSTKLDALEDDKKMSTMGDSLYLKPVDDDVSIDKHLMKELNKMIDSKVFNIEEGHSNLESLERKRSESFLLPLPDINYNDSDANNLRDKKTDDNKQSLSTSESFKSMTSENAVKDDGKEEAHIFLSTDEKEKDDIEPEISNNKEQNSNVSDALEILSEELSEERNKKVQFSHDNIGILKENEESDFINSVKESNLLNIEQLPVHSTESVKMEINFAPPNEHLLSDADDLWPDNLSPVGIKPSASVSKSITSLGKILESDEKSMLSPKDEETQDRMSQPPDTMETANSLDKEALPSDSQINHPKSLNSRLRDGFDSNDQNELIDLSEIGEPKQDSKAVKDTVLKEDNGFYDLKRVSEKLNKEEPIVSEFHDKYKELIGSLEPEVEKSDIKHDSFEQKDLMKEMSPKVLDVPKSATIASNKDKELKKVSPTVSGGFKAEINKIDIQDEFTELDKSVEEKLEATTGTLKPDIGIKNYPSDQSFVSSMMIELQKYGDKLQDIVVNSIRGQSKSDILPTPQSERSRSVTHTKSSTTSSKIQQRPPNVNVMSLPSPKKFDYRVHPKTAPSWTRRGQGEPGGSRKRRGLTDVMNEREREMRQWCKDLDNILENLDKWKKWLDYITKYINTMKVKAELNKFTPNSTFAAADRPKPTRSIDKEVPLWTKLNQRAKGGLKMHPTYEDTRLKSSRVNGARSPVPAKYCVNCGCKKQMRRLSRSPTRK